MLMTKEEAIERLNRIITTKFNNDYSIDSTDKEAIETVLSMLKEKDKEIEYQKEKRNNQKAELAILNEKQKEMNKLTNIVSSYKGMFKKQQKEIEKKDNIIDLMAEFIEKVTVDLKVAFGENMLWNRDEIKQYFERKANE